MGLTGQIAISSPAEEVRLFFDKTELPQAVAEAENGDQITLYAANYNSSTSAALNDLNINNGKAEVYVVALPGADLDYAAIDEDRLPQISDLNRLAVLDDILDPIDQFFPPNTGGDGQTLYYDANANQLKYTDVLLVDVDNDEVKVNNTLSTQDDVKIESETEPSVKTRLNELENLLPSAPALDSYTFSLNAVGQLGFGSSSPITGVENVPGEDIGDELNLNDSITTTDYDGNSITASFAGILDQFDPNPSGVLNDDVSSTSNHDADVFGRAEEGNLRLYVNGSEPSNTRADLESTSGSIDTISSGTSASGFDLSAASNVTFSDGSTFTGESQRSGQWQVDTAELRSGYNQIRVEHWDGNGNEISETSTIAYVLDDEGSSITFSALQFDNLSVSNTINWLSGVPRNTNATADLNATVENVYLYTYSSDSDAVDFATKQNFNEPPFPITDPSSSSDDFNINTTVDAEEIVFDEGFIAEITVKDPVEPAAISSSFSAFELMVDDKTNQNTDLDQRFDGEQRRIKSDENFNSDISTGQWDSTKTIEDGGDAGYDNGLQCAVNQAQDGHRLIYPTKDYTQINNGVPGSPDYSGSKTTGERFFYGLFTNSTATSNWSLKIPNSATLVSQGNASANTDEVEISIKLPTQTGWMDINEDFVTGQTADGDGAFAEVNGTLSNPQIGGGGTVGITTGTKSTTDSFDKLYYRVKAPNNWTGYISRIKINWAV